MDHSRVWPQVHLQCLHNMYGTSLMDAFFNDGGQGQSRRGQPVSGFSGPSAESAFGFGHFDPGAMFAQHQHMMRSLSEGSFGPMGFLPGPGRAYGVQVPRSPLLQCASDRASWQLLAVSTAALLS